MSGVGGGGAVAIGQQHSPPLTPLEGIPSHHHNNNNSLHHLNNNSHHHPHNNNMGDSFSSTTTTSSSSAVGLGNAALNGPASPSPTFTIGSPSSSSGNNYPNSVTSPTAPPQSSSFPPDNHPLSGCKHLCAICEDRASGKHYGVFSCEGCKGFFKRTVRKELQYSCRDSKSCTVDKRNRNRCQYCRYNKCLAMGMKREAVQEERQRSKNAVEKEAAPLTGGNLPLEMTITSIKEAEVLADPDEDTKPIVKEEDLRGALLVAVRRQLELLIVWAKHVPYFRDLTLNDQLILLKNGWNELLISALSHRSIYCSDGIMLAEGVIVNRTAANTIGIGQIYERVLTELVAKMRDMKMDKEELGCLRTIVLFNPDIKGLSSPSHIENLRERVYSTLEDYTKTKDVGRFPKLLLRLPALRSIGLRCIEHLFYAKNVNEELPPIDNYIISKLQEENTSSP